MNVNAKRSGIVENIDDITEAELLEWARKNNIETTRMSMRTPARWLAAKVLSTENIRIIARAQTRKKVLWAAWCEEH